METYVETYVETFAPHAAVTGAGQCSHRAPQGTLGILGILGIFGNCLGYFQDFWSNIRVFGPGEVGIV